MPAGSTDRAVLMIFYRQTQPRREYSECANSSLCATVSPPSVSETVVVLLQVSSFMLSRNWGFDNPKRLTVDPFLLRQRMRVFLRDEQGEKSFSR